MIILNKIKYINIVVTLLSRTKRKPQSYYTILTVIITKNYVL